MSIPIDSQCRSTWVASPNLAAMSPMAYAFPLDVLPHTDLVVAHAGQGTVTAAVNAGVPLVCVPMGRDQPAVADRVTRHGLGVRVEPDAAVEELRAAIDHALREPAFRDAARQMAQAIEPANRVVDELEALAAARIRWSRAEPDR